VPNDGALLDERSLVPESLGGFVWSWTHCAKCNNGLGTRVESGVKHDPTIRYAIEHALVDELPELAQVFAEGQPYFVQSGQGRLPRANALAPSSSARRSSPTQQARHLGLGFAERACAS
jgi:hypothetical protein